MLETVRARLTLWYVSLLAAILVVVLVMTYVLLARALYERIDDSLEVFIQIVGDVAGQRSRRRPAGRRCGAQHRDRAGVALLPGRDLRRQRPAARRGRPRRRHRDRAAAARRRFRPTAASALITIVEADDLDDRHRLAVRRVTVPPGVEYVIVVGSSLEPTDEELESLRGILAYVVPLSLVIAGLGGWFLARRSLSPVVAMADRARQIGVGSLNARLPVANPRDELGMLAGYLQRAAVAARSIGRAAAAVHGGCLARAAHAGDDRAHRGQRRAAAADAQRSRISRDARDHRAGNGPAVTHRRRSVHADARRRRHVSGRARRPCISTSWSTTWCGRREWWRRPGSVSIVAECVHPAPFTGDEDLIRRLVINVLDNAIRYSPPGGAVRVALDRSGDDYAVSVSDQGPGIAAEVQPQDLRALLPRRCRAHARRRQRRRCRARPGAGALDRAGARRRHRAGHVLAARLDLRHHPALSSVSALRTRLSTVHPPCVSSMQGET